MSADEDRISRRNYKDVISNPIVLAAVIAASASVGAATLEYGPAFGCRVFGWPPCSDTWVHPPAASGENISVSNLFEITFEKFDNEYLIFVNGLLAGRNKTASISEEGAKSYILYLNRVENFVTIIGINYSGPGHIKGYLSSDGKITRFEGRAENNERGAFYIREYVVMRGGVSNG